MRAIRVLVVDDALVSALAVIDYACEQLVPPDIRDFRDPWDRDFTFPYAIAMEFLRPEGLWDADTGRVSLVSDPALVRPVHNWRAAHYVCDRLRPGGMN